MNKGIASVNISVSKSIVFETETMFDCVGKDRKVTCEANERGIVTRRINFNGVYLFSVLSKALSKVIKARGFYASSVNFIAT